MFLLVCIYLLHPLTMDRMQHKVIFKQSTAGLNSDVSSQKGQSAQLFTQRSMLNITVIIVGNGISNPSSNPK